MAHTTILSKRKKWKRISQNRSERTSNIFFSCVIIVLKYFIYGWVFISFLLLSIYQCRQNVEKMRKKIFRVVSVEWKPTNNAFSACILSIKRGLPYVLISCSFILPDTLPIFISRLSAVIFSLKCRLHINNFALAIFTKPTLEVRASPV